MTSFPGQSLQRNPVTLPFANLENWAEGALVLVETDETQHIQSLKNGVDWLLTIVPSPDQTSGETAATKLLEKERQRVESWRQEMAAKNLELTRQKIELEAHRQQLQEWEDDLQGQKQDGSRH